MSDIRQAVLDQFRQRLGGEPAFLVRAPGRVNLIGEHTDYNDGFVFPMAIERAVWIALRPLALGRVSLAALDFGEQFGFSLADLHKGPASTAEYVKGVAWALREAGFPLAGFEGVMAGDVPIGAGLSSSAAVEIAVTRAFAAVSGFTWEPKQMALIAQKAENQWVGMNCGIMDQLISAAGHQDHALLIDCRSLDLSPAPLPAGTAVVILDTTTRRGLVGSAYNDRRAQCEAAAAHFRLKALRDITLAAFMAREGELDEVTRRRARHVISENERTLAARDAMLAGDAVALGALMRASHASLRDDFEVSNDALDHIVAAADAHPACFGARMTGAGFGGCAVALARADRVDEFVAGVSDEYQRRVGFPPLVYVSRAEAGASLEEI